MMTDTPETAPGADPAADDKGAEIRIVVAPNGEMGVAWQGLPNDKVVLYGLLEVAKDIIRKKLAMRASIDGPLIIPASGHRPRFNGGPH